MVTGAPSEFQLSTALSDSQEVGFHWMISDATGTLLEQSKTSYPTADEARSAGEVALEVLQTPPD